MSLGIALSAASLEIPGLGASATESLEFGSCSAVKELEGAWVLINLAGMSVNCRYHARNRKLLLDSRLKSTRVLGEAIARCASPPRVWLISSTATIYKHTYGPAWDEAGEIGGCAEAKDIFSVHVATEWERVFNEASTPRTRKVALRSAMVLGHAKNSVLPNLLRLGRLGLGGSLAGGRQFVSWIHQDDFCRAVEWIIKHENLRGRRARPGAPRGRRGGNLRYARFRVSNVRVYRFVNAIVTVIR